ncbi:MFS transporter [Derxia lacustris]|uniref:MFS transporter n=1 Tax=Derxia lacustris TaxID=764842 RepID=UPI000A16E9F3|nr:MFS transporter [Derxia lacustris]
MSATLAAPPAAPSRDAAVIALVGFAHAVSHFFHLLLAPLFPWLMPAFGIGFAEAGFLVTLFFAVSGTGQALAGFVVDRFGALPVLLAGVSSFVLAALALALAQGYGGLMLAAGLAGLGNCVFHPADFALLNRRVLPARLGHAFSMHGLAGNLGWAAAPPLLAGVAALAGWRAAALTAAAVAALAWLALWFGRGLLDDRAALARQAAAPVPAAATGTTGRFGFLGVRAVWLCFAFFLTSAAAFGLLQSFGAPTLEHVFGLARATSTFAITLFLLAGAVGTFVGGFVASRTEDNDRPVAVALLGSAAVAALLATGLPPAWAVLPMLAAMGFGVGVAGPNRDLLVRRAAAGRFAQASYGRVYGFVYSGLDLGLGASPLLLGPALDAGRFRTVLVCVAVAQALAVLSAWRVGSGRRALATPQPA